MSAPLASRDRERTPRAPALAGLPLAAARGAGRAPRGGVRRARGWRAAALALLAALSLAGCGGPTFRATVVNASRANLAELRLVGERDSTRLPELAPGDSAVVSARVRGEDAIVLRGALAGRPLVPMLAAYVEAGYRVRLVVDSTGFVAVTALGGTVR